ncbi:MDR family MFS transporter [Catellatospora methionotrophica]|uniref:MDR family MFS transporter n=1 Tax=Catellatospora methionotrophica TaxID=121620 RepID=UPI0033C618C3
MSSAPVDVGFRSERGPILISLMLCSTLVAIDATVIATAVPSVVASLGGFAQFPWLFSVYLLAQAVTVPVYGKLADLFGRKPVMLFGIGLFLLGSILCGLAWSMPALIVFRAVQGLGAGAIQPMSLTIAGDTYSTAERGKVQGYLASVWGMSAVVGPTLGGLFSEYLTWRWIFFINIPLCLLAGTMLARNLHERVESRRHRLDYLGAALLTCGSTLLILGLLEGGVGWPWLSPAGLGVPAAAVLLLGWFVQVQRRAAEPVLPLWVFRHRLLVTCSLVSLAVGAVLFGLTSYVPTFVQGVLGTGPLVAGFALATLTLGWPLTASQSSRAYLRIGFRATALIGSAGTITGSLLMVLLDAQSSVYAVGGCCFLIGAGLGFVAAPTLIAAQSTVGWSQRGVVTGNNMFSRSMGSALGVALFGSVANNALRSGATGSAVGDLAAASHDVFIAVAVAAVLMGVAVFFMPKVHVVGQDDAAAP